MNIDPRPVKKISHLKFAPLTPSRWRDLEELFGERGACGGCWCMWWRLKRSEWEKKRGAGNKRALKKMVKSGAKPGLLAYVEGKPVAWCALAPREDYPVLERSRPLQRVDERPVWSVTCFFVAKPFRRRGVTVELLRAAAGYARKRGARILEGYPVAPKKGARWADPFVYTGHVSAFRRAGFREVARRSPTRPILRRFL